MISPHVFDIPTPGLFQGSYLAEVVNVADPEELSRVQVRLLNCDGMTDQNGPIWARVAAPFAGNQRGAFFIPDVGDEVLIVFVHGDSRWPIVVGGLWNGNAAPPETLGGAGDRVDRWTLVGRAGTRIAIVEERDGQETIAFSTPGGVTGELTDTGGGKFEVQAAGATITINTQGISIQSPGKVEIQASQVEVSSGIVNVNAGFSKFSGVVQCDTLISNAVVSASYTPGAGNIW